MKIFTACLLGLLSLCAFAEQPLPAKEIFIPTIEQTLNDGQFKTTVRITMPEGHYLYVDKTDLRAENAEGELEKSPGQQHEDEYKICCQHATKK